MVNKIDQVSKAIEKSRASGIEPIKIRMSRSFAIALKEETIPEIEKYYIDGRMTVSGVPWEIDVNIRGFALE